MLDFATCTECGRCQSQCPAWNTEKPLSPKMLIMNLRDHAFAKAPYILAAEGDRAHAAGGRPRPRRSGRWSARPRAWPGSPTGGAVIDTDVLWSCVTCGACVKQCPVDIEHVDHIIDMRRYQVLVESNFPAELNQLFKGMENKGNPWNMSPTARMDWAKDLDFEVKVVGEDVESLDEVEWLFWVGCAGAYEDRQKKTTRAVAELLDMAGVSFAVLGNGETCTGDQARRAGNEFVFQGLAAQNVETFKEFKVKKVVSTCAHCFNTLKNEYTEFGVELEVVHHTQLLNRLVREGKLTPVADGAGAAQAVDHLPRPLLHRPPQRRLLPAARAAPGAARRRVRRDGAQLRAVLLLRRRRRPHVDGGEHRRADQRQPHQRGGRHRRRPDRGRLPVLPGDALRRADRRAAAKGKAREEVEVLDVAQMLLASVKGEMATRPRARLRRAAAAAARCGGACRDGDGAQGARPRRPAAETEEGDATATETAEAGPAAKASRRLVAVRHPGRRRAGARGAAGAREPRPVGSLFDLAAATRSPSLRRSAEPAPDRARDRAGPGSGGSLFDIADDAAPEPERAEPEPAGRGRTRRPSLRPPADRPDPLGRLAVRHRAPTSEPEPEPEPEAEEPKPSRRAGARA